MELIKEVSKVMELAFEEGFLTIPENTQIRISERINQEDEIKNWEKEKQRLIIGYTKEIAFMEKDQQEQEWNKMLFLIDLYPELKNIQDKNIAQIVLKKFVNEITHPDFHSLKLGLNRIYNMRKDID